MPYSTILYCAVMFYHSFVGPVDMEVRTFGQTVVPIPYSVMHRRRHYHRSNRNTGISGSVDSSGNHRAHSNYDPPRTYFITVASEETAGLRALITSAFLSGVHVEVCSFVVM